MGVLKSNAGYVILSEKYPKERIKLICDEIKAKLIIDEEVWKEFLLFNSELTEIKATRICPNDCAYIVFTSGTTGVPKGVIHTHRSILAHINRYSSYLKLSSDKKQNVLLLVNFIFSVSTTQIFSALLNGHTLFISESNILDNNSFLTNFININQINYFQATPAIFDSLDLSKIKSLEIVALAGEKISPQLFLKAEKNNISLVNVYGQSEFHAATANVISNVNEVNIIGKALPGNELYLLDDNLKEVGYDEQGEIFVLSDQLANGYLNDQLETSKHFIRNPFGEGVLCRTGDLALRHSNGTYEFIGRKDFQLNINGIRIEPGEIEKSILSVSDIEKVVVVEKKSKIVAYYIAHKNIVVESLRKIISTKLPPYMVPNYFIQLKELPLNSNGKLDRNKLPDFIKVKEYKNYDLSNLTPNEALLAEQLDKQFGIKVFNLNNSFISLGGNSLQAIKLSNELYKLTGKRIPSKSILTSKSLKLLAKLLEKIPLTEESNVIINNVNEMTSSEKRMYIIYSQNPDSTLYNEQTILKFDEKIDVLKMKKALNLVVNNYDILRTKFSYHNGVYQRRVTTEGNFEFLEEILDTSFEKFIKPFNLEDGLTMRVYVLHDVNSDYLLIDKHHIITDGISEQIFYKKLSEFYLHNSSKTQEKISLVTFQPSNEKIKKEKLWWRKHLEGFNRLNLVKDLECTPNELHNGNTIITDIESTLNKKIEEISKNNNISEYTIYFTAFTILLSKMYNSNDFVVGTVSSGRNYYNQNNMGMFANTLPIKVSPKSNIQLEDYLNDINDILLSAIDNQGYPFEQLVSDFKEESQFGNPFFDCMFVYQNYNEQSYFNGRARKIAYKSPFSKFKLTFEIEVLNDKKTLYINYDSSYFNEDTINNLKKVFYDILQDINLEQNKILGEIPLVKIEKNQEITESIFESAISLFEQNVKEQPAKEALKYKDIIWSYNDLNEEVNRVANCLLTNYHISKDSIVPLLLDRSDKMVIAILAVLKTGAAYTPISKKYPKERINYIIETCGSDFIIDDKFMNRNFDNYSSQNPKIELTSSDLAYIIFTSGTTGKPKGVMVEHGNLSNYCMEVSKVENSGMYSKNINAAFFEYVFDASLHDLVRPFVHGECCVIFDTKLIYDIDRFLAELRKYSVNAIGMTPSLAGKIDLTQVPTMRTIFCGGEAITQEVIKKYNGTQIQLKNCYGPTETTIMSFVNNNVKDTSIGKPIGGVYAYILDDDLNLLPKGAIGNLYIGGKQVTRGYINQPEETQKHFISNPFNSGKIYETGDLVRERLDGSYEYLGRKDFQVKVRGYRIELGEIEKTIISENIVKQVAVIPYHDNLVAYYVSNEKVSNDVFETVLSSRLPNYMVPQFYIKIDFLPTTLNGKLDEKLLPKPNFDDEYQEPVGENEKEVADAFCKVLKLERVSANMSFFKLGGNSIAAIALANLINLPVKEIFDKKTVHKIAAILGKKEALRLDSSLKERRNLSFEQEQLLYIDSIEGGTSAYNIPLLLHLNEKVDVNKLEEVLHKVFDRHKVLKTIIGATSQKIVDNIDIGHEDINYGNFFNYVFDLRKEVPIRVNIFKKELAINIHHIAFDGWSTNILIDEIQKLYNNQPLKSLTYQYSDFANWQQKNINSEILKSQKEYWVNQLQGYENLDFPLDKPRPKYFDYKGKEFNFELSNELYLQLKQVAKENDTSLYVVMLSAFILTLSAYANQNDIVLGTPIANRNIQGTEDLIGYFVNTLVMRLNINNQLSIKEFLLQNDFQVAKAQENQNYPFELLVSDLKIKQDLSRNPIFQIMFGVQDIENVSLDSNLLNSIENDYSLENTKFDLSAMVFKNRISFNYAESLFFEETISQFAKTYELVLKQFINTELLLKDLQFSTDKIYINEANYPKLTVNKLFEKVVANTPNKVALVYNGKILTYSELNKRANRLANTLIEEYNVKRGTCIPILMDRSEKYIIAILAILKVGACYVPLSKQYPEERVEYIVDKIDAPLILDETIMVTSKNISNPDIDLSINDLAYIIFTSGTTGKPKGVMIEHRGIVNTIYNQIEYFNINQSTRIMHFADFVFDASVYELFYSLLSGATLYLLDNETRMDYQLLQKFVIDNKIELATLPPAILNNHELLSLKNLIVAGESTPEEIYKAYYSQGINITNAYGPTEITVCATVKRYEPNMNAQNIGYPQKNIYCLVLNSSGKILPENAIGELYIGGAGLARGYFKDEEKTLASFINHPVYGRLYRTGDLVKKQHNGELIYIGRDDFQVKLRGFRIELGEVEAQLMKEPLITRCVVQVKGNNLVAYYTGTLSYKLDGYLPSYMVPNYYIHLDEFPLTINGKIDLRKLPEPVIVSQNFETPSTSREKEIATQICDLLKIDKVSINDNFYEIGGNSILALKLSMRINLQVKQIIEAKTIKQMALLAKEEMYKPIRKVQSKKDYCTSVAQEQLWVINQFSDTTAAYNIPIILKLSKNVDRCLLVESLQKIVDRHEVLRTVIKENRQYITNETFGITNDPIVVEDYINEPFNLSKEIPIKANLFGDLLVINIHHIAFDGWSTELFLKELTNNYYKIPTSTLRYQYKDYANWQREFLDSEAFDNQKEFWLKQLEDYEVLNLPNDFNRPKKFTYRGKNIEVAFKSSWKEGLEKVAKDYKTSLYVVMLTIFDVVLSQFSYQEDIIVGSPFANRHIDGTNDLIGFFVNSLPIRTKVGYNQEFKELVFYNHKQLLAIQKNQDIPFEKIVKGLNAGQDLSRNPIYQVFFSVQDFTSEIMQDNELFEMLGTTNINKFAKYDLSVMLENGLLIFNYCDDIFSKDTIESIKQSYIELIETVINNENFKISEILFTEKVVKGEKKKYSSLSVVELFYKQVNKTPQNIAVEYQDTKLTYKEFDEKTNCFANYLLSNGVKPGDSIALLLPRSERMSIAIWGTLKAGCSYVPISSEYPKERIEYILNESGAKFLVKDDFAGFLYNDSSSINVNIHLNDLAYIIFTSGTTGKPKGVMIEHAGLSNRIQWMNDKYPLRENDIVYQKTNYVFDVSVWEQIWALLVGAKIVFAKEGGHKDPLYLAEEIKNKKITTMHFVPSMLDVFLDTVEVYSESNLVDLSSLNYVFCSGEALSLSSVKKFKKILPNTQLHNLYGPTEASIDVTYFDCNKSNIEKVLIGRPVANIDCYILSKSNKILPKGAIGELAISGVQLARGYINHPELTSKSFITLKNYGRVYKTGDLARVITGDNIEYLGRNDFQVKINGLRIELGEVEKRVLEIQEVQQAAALKVNNQLVVYYVSSKELQVEYIKECLSTKLPSYMVPSIFMFMKKFPLTINGKLNRRALPIPKNESKVITDAKNDVEKQLQIIIAKLLGLEVSDIDILANFFNLGGDSIKAIQLSNKIKQQFDISIPVSEIFDAKSIRNIAKLINKNETQPIISEQEILTGELGLLPIQKWFFDHNYSNCFNQGFGIKLPNDINLEKLRKALVELVNYHDAMRIYFKDGKQYYGDKVEQINLQIVSDNTELADFDNKFDLSKCLYKFVYISSENILGVICHHLIIDTVSWQIITADLKTIYSNNSLPSKGTSYRQWEKELSSRNFDFVNDYPKHFQDFETQKEVGYNTFEFTKDTTTILLNGVNKVYNTSTKDILLTALARALQRIWGSEETYVQLESHGRANIGSAFDVQRTVGWFTSIYPQKISTDLVKTKLYTKKISDLGIGYGLSNGIHPQNLPKIMFNYLGQISVSTEDWSIIKKNLGKMSDVNSKEVLLINGGVYQKQLFIELGGKIKYFDLISVYLKEEINNLILELQNISRTYLTSDDIKYLISQESLDNIQQDKELVDILPANSLQKGFVYQSLNNAKNDNAYVCAYTFEYDSTVDVELYRKAWSLAQEKYPSLRLALDVVDGEVVQLINKKGSLDFSYIETDDIDDLICYERNKLFSLSDGNLFRIRLIKTSNDKYVCLLVNHHAILDGWSNSLLLNSVHEFYYNLYTNNDIHFEEDTAYFIGQRFIDNNLEKSREYWKKKLTEVSHPDISGLFRGENSKVKLEEVNYIEKPRDKDFKLDDLVYNSLKKFSRNNGITPNIILQYAWHKLLSVYGGVKETTIGVVNSGRQIPVEDIESSVGLYIQTVPIQFKHSNNDLKSELEELQKVNQQALVNGGISIAELQTNRTRLFDTMFIYENYPIESNSLPKSPAKLDVSNVRAVEKLDYPLTLIAFEKDNSLYVQFKYASELFEDKVIEILFEFMNNVINQIVNENSSLKYVYSTPKFETEKYSQSTIVEKFEEQVSKTPEVVAVKCENNELTYDKLNSLSNILARNLITRFNIQPGDRVPLLLEKSEKMLIAILGILKAGAAYVPMSPRFPSERIKYITTLVESKVVIDEELIDELLSNNESSNLNIKIKSDFLAYIIFTSGTTGNPKGVMVEHRNFLCYLNNMLSALHANGIEDIEFGCIAEYVFDIFGTEVFGQLLRGKTVSLFTGTPEDFPKYMKNNRITVLQSTPGKISYLFQDNDQEILNTNLTTILVGGEKMNAAFAKRFSNINLINIYGPTEGTVWTSMKKVENNYSNIGTPFDNYVHYVLDEQMRLLPDGAIGELYIGGPQLSRGYYGKEELTARMFRNNPYNPNNLSEYSRIYKTGDVVRRLLNGEFELIGRNDFQVKIRGFRIELGEIEAAMLKIPEVTQVLATALGKEENKYLGVYYTATKELSREYIEEILSQYLTDYMIPSGYQFIKNFPLTINGKIDRRALPSITYSSSVEYVEPRNKEEKIVRDCIADILGISKSKLSVLENFFNIGGDSIKAIKLISNLNSNLDKKFDIKVIFKNKTIEKIANVFAQNAEIPKNADTLNVIKRAFRSEEEQVLSYVQKQYLESPKTSYSNVKIAFKIKEKIDIPKLIVAVEHVVNRHEVLRTKLHKYYQKVSSESFIVTQDTINRDKYFEHIFDLQNEIPIKANINNGIFTCVIDHVAFDGWSASVFLKDIERYYYDGYLPKLDFQYKDYAKCQQEFLDSYRVETQVDFWRKEFINYKPMKGLSVKKKKSSDHEGADEYLHLNDNLYEEIIRFVKANDTTVHNLLLSIFFLTVKKFSGQENISIMIPSLNRSVKGVENLIGLFINRFLVNVTIDDNILYSEFLDFLNNKIIDYQNNQDVPFELVADKLNLDIDGYKLYFGIQGFKGEALKESTLFESLPEMNTKAQKEAFSDLTIFVWGQNIDFNYATSSFSREEILEFVNLYETILLRILNTKKLNINTIIDGK